MVETGLPSENAIGAKGRALAAAVRVRPRAVLKWLCIAVLGYAAAVVLLYAFQRDLLYFNRRTAHTAPAAVGLPAAEEVVLATADGERVIAWHIPPRGDRPVVLLFHGAGDVLARRAGRFHTLTADGTGLVALSYRGYGGSSGRPSEHGVLLDAAAAYVFAAARYAPERIVVWGISLGTGPAVVIAAERPVGKLVLEAPYTSTVDIAASFMPIVPVRTLMKDQFRSDERIGQVTAPLLVLHGERDRTIAIRFGERLFALAREPKRLVRFPNGGHNNLDRHGAIEEARHFIYAQ
jgi:uncharacterized protein